jgi:hypothetical protein
LRAALLRCLAAACLAVALPVAAQVDDVIESLEIAALPAVAVVDEFPAALEAGDLDRVRALLADDVLVLESGSAGRRARRAGKCRAWRRRITRSNWCARTAGRGVRQARRKRGRPGGARSIAPGSRRIYRSSSRRKPGPMLIFCRWKHGSRLSPG